MLMHSQGSEPVSERRSLQVVEDLVFEVLLSPNCKLSESNNIHVIIFKVRIFIPGFVHVDSRIVPVTMGSAYLSGLSKTEISVS